MTTTMAQSSTDLESAYQAQVATLTGGGYERFTWLVIDTRPGNPMHDPATYAKESPYRIEQKNYGGRMGFSARTREDALSKAIEQNRDTLVRQALYKAEHGHDLPDRPIPGVDTPAACLGCGVVFPPDELDGDQSCGCCAVTPWIFD